MATTSDNQRLPPVRALVEMSIAGRSNMRLATMAPRHPPITCAITYTGQFAVAQSAEPTVGEAHHRVEVRAGDGAEREDQARRARQPSRSSSRAVAIPRCSVTVVARRYPIRPPRRRAGPCPALRRRPCAQVRGSNSAAPRGRLGCRRATHRVLVRTGLDGSELPGRHLNIGEDGVDLPRLAVGRVDPDLVLHSEAT